MSEEQNLFEAVAAPPPQRAKRQVKPKAKAASVDAPESPRQADESHPGSAETPKRSPRAKKSAAAAPVAGAPLAFESAAPERAAAEPAGGAAKGVSRSGDSNTQSSPAYQPVEATSHRSETGEVLVERRSRTHETASGTPGRDARESGQDAATGRDDNFSSPRRVAGEERADGGSSEAREHAAVADGAGSMAGMSKSRRRRRKRKNRAAAAAEAANTPNGGSNAGSIQASGDGSAPATAATDAPVREFRQNVQGGGQNTTGHHAGGGQNFGQNNQGPGSRRKKKKFRRAGEGEGQSNGQGFTPRPPRPEPGNSLQGSNSGGMGQRRNRKQGGGYGDRQNRGPRTFVGPMDHSYREVNGNFADGPASTIQVNGGRHRNNGHRQFNEDRLPPELMHNNRPVVIPEGAPTHIYFFIEDLFFTAKIQEAAKQQGVKVAFMKPEKDVVAHLSELHDHEHPSLIVFDLNNANAKPLTLIPKLKAKLKKGTSILGFLSHLQGDLKQKAVEAGCHTVMPKSAFSQNLPNLLRRYGVEDEHEPNYNQ